eukprot:COSAG04_NODE_3547_length_2718_cov_1.038183_2_plen_697_part_00
MCHNTFGSFTCACRSGGAGTSDGVSCADVLARNPSASSGPYALRVSDGQIIDIFCDFRGDGSTWALVMLHNQDLACPGPNARWDAAINQNVVSASGFDASSLPRDTAALETTSVMVGLKYWQLLGDVVMIEMGDSHTTISNRAEASFAFDVADNYALELSDPTITVGSETPGLFESHNGQRFTTSDADHDTDGESNCAQGYLGAPWWYTDCWSGSIWGGCADPQVPHHANSPYWAGSGSDSSDNALHGAIWVGQDSADTPASDFSCPTGSECGISADDGGCVEETDCSHCGAGYASQAGGRCTPCNATGMISNADRTSCSPCVAGTGPNAARDGCDDCSAGFYSMFGVCQECMPPNVVNQDRTSCSPCVAGTGPNAARDGCDNCTDQTYSRFGVCQECASPNLVSEDRTSCVAPYVCAPGSQCTRSATEGGCQAQHDCSRCPPGTFRSIGEACTFCTQILSEIPNPEQVACQACPPGTKASDDSANCVCEVGFYDTAQLPSITCFDADFVLASTPANVSTVGTSCRPCPHCMDCSTAQPKLMAQYQFLTATAPVSQARSVFKCPVAFTCLSQALITTTVNGTRVLAAQSCPNGTAGALCGVCESGWRKGPAGRCILCNSNGEGGFSFLRLSSVLFLLSAAALIGYVALRKLLTFKRQMRREAFGAARQMFAELDTDGSGEITRCAFNDSCLPLTYV